VSPVVRVRPTPVGPPEPVPPPRRVELGLAELLVAAELAGGVPLPFGGPAVAPEGGDRLATRLAGSPPTVAVDRVAARASLAERGLVGGDGALVPPVAAALSTVVGAPLVVVLDVAVRRRSGTIHLRSWHGVVPGLLARLTLLGPTQTELGWADPRSWVAELTRQVEVTPWVPQPAPLVLPERVQLPSELLRGAARAHRERRPDLLGPMADGLGDRVRLGERPAEVAEVLALLRTLTGGGRGRLRLLATRRDRRARPVMSTWLLLDDGWHDVRPGRGATSVLRRREPADLGRITWPLVGRLVAEGAA
jgi:hypothetical protein